MPGCESARGIPFLLQSVAKRAHLRRFIVDDKQLGNGRVHHADRSSEAAESGSAVNSASAPRTSASLGGLLRTRSTCAGMSFSASKRLPHPVRSTTGVSGEAALIAAATLRPSTYRIPTSVITSENGAFPDHSP